MLALCCMPASPALLADDLRVRLGGAEILRGVALRVEPGDVYGLLGRNGAGKTTTMRCLLGLLPATGRRELFGVSADRIASLGPQLGVSLDLPGLDEGMTVRQNLKVAAIRGGLTEGRSVEEALALVQLEHRATHRADRLSVGQRRRASLARALLGAPKLLVLDEPLSGLDPEGVEQVLSLFRRLSSEEGVTVVLSSHHLREVEDVCTHVGMIEQGRTILQGNTHELLAAAGDRLRIEAESIEAAHAHLSERNGIRAVERTSATALDARIEPSIDLAVLLRELVAAGVQVQEFSRVRASLVDVFRNAVEGELEP